MQIFLAYHTGQRLVINKQKQKLITNRSKINIKKKLLTDYVYWKLPLHIAVKSKTKG